MLAVVLDLAYALMLADAGKLAGVLALCWTATAAAIVFLWRENGDRDVRPPATPELLGVALL